MTGGWAPLPADRFIRHSFSLGSSIWPPQAAGATAHITDAKKRRACLIRACTGPIATRPAPFGAIIGVVSHKGDGAGQRVNQAPHVREPDPQQQTPSPSGSTHRARCALLLQTTCSVTSIPRRRSSSTKGRAGTWVSTPPAPSGVRPPAIISATMAALQPVQRSMAVKPVASSK